MTVSTYIIIGLFVGWVLGIFSKRTETSEMKEQFENRHRLDEKELELANERISELEHELMVKRNVIKSIDEKLGRLQKIVKQVKEK